MGTLKELLGADAVGLREGFALGVKRAPLFDAVGEGVVPDRSGLLGLASVALLKRRRRA